MTLRSQSCQKVCVCVCVTNDTMCTLGQSVKIAYNQQNPFNNLNKILENHIQTSYSQVSSKTHNPRNLRQKMWITLRTKQNPYLFLKIGEEMRENMEVLCVNTLILKEGRTDKTMNSHVMRGKIEKFLKTTLTIILIVQNTWFLRLDWVANESPKTLGQILKNLSNCFSQLEGLLTSKSRQESLNILSKPRD